VTDKPKTDQADALLTKLNAAVKAVNETQTELWSRSTTVGRLLLEAKKLYPKVKDFEAFLKRVDGLHLSRAYDFMRLAGGRTTDAELREEARNRKRKSRAKPKPLPKPAPAKPTPQPKSEPERFRDVTESAEESAERRKAENAQTPAEKAAAESARNLREFEYAGRLYLPKLNEADLNKARTFVDCDLWLSKKKDAA
jgi:hypothetical protein